MTVFDFYLRPFFQIFVLNATFNENGARFEISSIINLFLNHKSLRYGADANQAHEGHWLSLYRTPMQFWWSGHRA